MMLQDIDSPFDTCKNKCTTHSTFDSKELSKCQNEARTNKEFFGDPVLAIPDKRYRMFKVENDIIRIDDFGEKEIKITLKSKKDPLGRFLKVDCYEYDDYVNHILSELNHLVYVLETNLDAYKENKHKFWFFNVKVVLGKKVRFRSYEFVTFVKEDKIYLKFSKGFDKEYVEDYMTIGGYNFSEFWIKYKPIIMKDIQDDLQNDADLIKAFHEKYEKYLILI